MVEIINYLLYLIISIFIVNRFLTFFQQNHYHLNFYLNSYKYFHYYDLLLFGSLIQNLIVKYLLLLFYFIMLIKEKYIVKLKITARIKRIYIILLMLIIIHIVFLESNYFLILNFIYLYISILIAIPLEKSIGLYYLKKAKEKLKKINPLNIVITGSAGKTSVKNYLYEILSKKHITFMTPLSYNTPLGIARSINETMNVKTEVAIFEFGASHKNDISKLLKIVKPNIGIITNILPQHLKTFKKIENVFNEKLKLFKNSDICIYNSDVISPIVDKEKKVITISKQKIAKYKLSDVEMFKEETTFKINNYFFKTKLLGECNVDNIILAIITARELGFSNEEIKDIIYNIKPVENRLEVKIINHNDRKIVIINDSFNSNVNGFKNALNILNDYHNKKAVITPGIMECGKKSKDINYKVGDFLKKSNAYVYIIKNKESKYIEESFAVDKYTNYIVYDKFIDAYNDALKKFDVILIENDISDIYK